MTKPTQLTIEHLAAYLPYDVGAKWNKYPRKRFKLHGVLYGKPWLIDSSSCTEKAQIHDIKLVLRPLSQLTVPITHNGETFVPIQRILTDFDYDMSRVFVKGSCVLLDCLLGDMTLLNCNLEYLGYNKAQLLLSWHFDVFSLGNNGLCVYMNPDGTI